MKKRSKSNLNLVNSKKIKENSNNYNTSYKIPFLRKKSTKLGFWKKSFKKGAKSKNHDILF